MTPKSDRSSIPLVFWISTGLWVLAHYLPSAIIQELQGEWASPTHDYYGWQCFLVPLSLTFSPLVFIFGPTVLVWISNLSQIATFGFLINRSSKLLAYAVIIGAIFPLFAITSLVMSGTIKGLGPGFILWQFTLMINAVIVWNACDLKPSTLAFISVVLPLLLFGLHYAEFWNSPGAKNSRAIKAYFKKIGDKRIAPPSGLESYAPSFQFFIAFDKHPPPLRLDEQNRAVFFSNAAFNFDEPQFCEKVDPRAATGADQTFETIKSMCYRQLAMKTRNIDLCQKVDSSSHVSKFTRRYCENLVRSGRPVDLPGRFDTAGSDTAIFQEAGLPDDNFNGYAASRQTELDNLGSLRASSTRTHQIFEQYQAIRTDPGFIESVKNLVPSAAPASPGSIYEATPEERMKYFVGSDDGLPELCEQIPRGANANKSNALFLRNLCFYTAAQKKHDPSVCDRIQTVKVEVPVFPGVVDRDWTSPESCKAALQSLGIRPYNSQAVEFVDNHGLGVPVLEEMLPKLGQKLPDLTVSPSVHLNPYILYTQYYAYIVEKAPDPEREEFKGKLMRLKSEPDESANALLPRHVYRNAKYGFELQFPGDVKVNNDNDESIKFSASGLPYARDTFSVQIEDIYDGQDSLEGIVNHVLKYEPRDEVHNVMVNGIPAARIIHWPGGKSFEYVVVHNGKLFHFANYGGQTPAEFDPIINTLKFMES